MQSYDGRCAQLWRSVCTVGVFHGRPRTAALEAFLDGGERRSRASIPAGRPAVREPSRDKGGRNGAGDRRQALPVTGSSGAAAGSQGLEISGSAACTVTSANRYRRPMPLHESYHRA